MAPSNPTAEATLTRQAVSGSAWSAVSTASRQILTLASVATVARLLGPAVYGVLGMASLLMIFIFNFRDLGTGSAIVQRPSVSNRLLSSLFWVNFCLGIAMALVVIAASPLTAAFFQTRELIPILSTLSLSFWFTSCGIVPNSILVREMRFKSIAIADVGAGLANYLVALGFAYSGFGVWSLVFANLTGSFTATLLYWWACPWRPSLEFDAKEVKSVTGFSLHLWGFGIVNYFARNADNIIVGKVLGQSQLGNYQMAYNLMLQPIQNVSNVIGQVTLPAFAKIQQDNERFRRAYMRSCMMIALITFPVMAGLGVVADPLIRAVLGSKWIGSILIFQILAPVGFVQSIPTGQIYVAKGRTDWMFRWVLAATALFVPAFFVGAQFGTVGVASAYCFVYLGLIMVPGFLIAFKLIGLEISQFAYALLPQLLITAAMAMLCALWLHGLAAAGVMNDWIRLLSTSLLGALFYIATLMVLRPPVMRVMEEVITHSSNPSVLRILTLLRILRPSAQ